MTDQAYFRKQSALRDQDIKAAMSVQDIKITMLTKEIAEIKAKLEKLGKENDALKNTDTIKGCVLEECIDANNKLYKQVSIYESYITDIINTLMMMKEDLDSLYLTKKL